MAHKYNDIVTLVRGEVETPALVVQSSQQADGEHLQVVSLDPAKASPLLSGQNVDAAIRKDYVTPLENGKTFGWKEQQFYPEDQAAHDALANAHEAAITELKKAGDAFKNGQDDVAALHKELKEIGVEFDAEGEPFNREAAGLAKQLSEKIEEVASLHAKITEMEAILNQAPEPAPPQPSAAEQLDAAQGEVEPGDPNSPHTPDAPQE